MSRKIFMFFFVVAFFAYLPWSVAREVPVVDAADDRGTGYDYDKMVVDQHADSSVVDDYFSDGDYQKNGTYRKFDVQSEINASFDKQLLDLRSRLQKLEEQLKLQEDKMKSLEKQISSYSRGVKNISNSDSAIESVHKSSFVKSQLAVADGKKGASNETAQLKVERSGIDNLNSAKNGTGINDKGDLNAFEEAFSNVIRKNYAEVVATFNKYLKDYPNGKFVPDAYYWLGEVYMLRGRLSLAQENFELILDRYPGSKKVPEAKLKLAIMYLKQGKTDLGKKELQDIKTSYPDSIAAKLADAQLSQLG